MIRAVLVRQRDRDQHAWAFLASICLEPRAARGAALAACRTTALLPMINNLRSVRSPIRGGFAPSRSLAAGRVLSKV